MRTSTLMLLVGTLAVMTGSLAAQTPTIKGFANDEVELKDILLASPRAGKNRLTAKLVNLGQKPANYAVDIRTEGVSLGMSNYQAFYGYQVSGGQTLSIEVPYEVMAPVISRLIIRLGKLPGPFDREAYSRQSREWQREHPSPRPEYIWREIVTFDVAGQYEKGRGGSADDHAVLLSPIRAEQLPELKVKIPGLITGRKGSDKREPLRKAFYTQRDYPTSFDKRPGTWEGTYDYGAHVRNNGHFIDLFSISAEAGNRISGFFVTRNENVDKKRPMIVFLGGNPGGTKEDLIRSVFPFTFAGYHVLCVERRASARVLDSLDKFLSNTADPVTDVIRTLDFIEREYGGRISSIGLYGFSKGAIEAKFVAALDDRIGAIVSVVGATSNNALFKDKERWIPTFSGLIIYPAIGLPSPFEKGEKLNPDSFQRYKDMAKPEHNLLAKEAYERLVPYFDALDSVHAMPLVAPVPLLIVTGADDVQITVDGAVEVDEATRAAYRAYGLEPCHDLVIQPRAGHYLSRLGENVVMAFLSRWLN